MFENCLSPAPIDITHTIVTSSPTGTTGEISIEIPPGYTYSSISCTGTFCPTFDHVFTDTATGKSYIILRIPSGMNSGDQLIYTVNLAPAPIAIGCGNHTIEIVTYDNFSGIMCGTTACAPILTETGNYTFNFSVTKPDYAINSVSGSFDGSNYTGSITVQNTSTVAPVGPLTVTLYCADDAGVSTGQVLGTYTFTANIAPGTSRTENFSVNGTTCTASGRVVAVINNFETCACSPTSNSPTVFCFKPAQTAGTALDTPHGITALGRAGSDNGNWPMARKGAWTVLESKTKGFVINRLTDAEIAALPASQLIEGMMVYNTTQNCLYINTDGTATGWNCFNNQGCPN